jgi:hypothetical protein
MAWKGEAITWYSGAPLDRKPPSTVLSLARSHGVYIPRLRRFLAASPWPLRLLEGLYVYTELPPGFSIVVYYTRAEDCCGGDATTLSVWAPNGIGQPAGHDGLTPRPPRMIDDTHVSAERASGA